MKPTNTSMDVTAEPRPGGDVTFHVAADVTVPLTEKHVMDWLTACSDKTVLERVAKYARYCLNSTVANESDTDDFRSRA